MARLLGTLRSSQPVARFQRSCGLFPAAEEGGGSGDPAERPRERGVCNGAGALRCPAAAVRGAPGGARSGRGPQLQVFAERCTCVSLLVTLGRSMLIRSFLRLGSFKVRIIRTVGFYGVVTLTLLCLYCHNCLKGSQVLLSLRTGAMFTNCLMMFSDCMALAHAVGEEDNKQDDSQVVVTETEKGCTQKYIVKNYFYYYLFKFSAALGEEIFYITFLPFTYWNIDHSVSRRMIIVWSIVMYIGQVSKDILKWPRPLSPPVVKLEMRTNAEYGMPSTHAMAATAISFSFFIATTNQYKYPLELGLVAAFVFSTLVCLSRLYTGMHTVLDVIGGALISAVLLVLLYPAWDTIDHLLLTSPFCPLFSIVVPLVLCYNYPKLDYYSPTRGDTTTILGAAAGATVGFWLNNQYAAPAYTSKTFQPGFPLITSAMVFVLARFLVGISVVLLTRWVMKSAVLGALGYRYQFPIRDLEARRRLEVEVPYKFVTYSSVGFTATVIVPLLHELLGLM